MITKDIEIEDIVENYPYLVPELAYHGIICVACGEPIWGTLKEQADRKDITEEKFGRIINEMNRIIAEKSADCADRVLKGDRGLC
ncbi:MAG: hypothetical protein B6244_12890 [Candidatus Cloacimonetes bacterium 4572_55]|nr:MAG: hypothetical protein B6244_12890 [Candidatus Cloacimonetes bacterium 4572_55]